MQQLDATSPAATLADCYPEILASFAARTFDGVNGLDTKP